MSSITEDLVQDMRDVRKDQQDTNRNVSKLWTAHRELATEVHGINGDNGIRSQVKKLEECQKIVEEKISDIPIKKEELGVKRLAIWAQTTVGVLSQIGTLAGVIYLIFKGKPL